jgi:hypothetical protein
MGGIQRRPTAAMLSQPIRVFSVGAPWASTEACIESKQRHTLNALTAAEPTNGAAKQRRTREWSPAARKAAAARMKAYWAKRKAGRKKLSHPVYDVFQLRSAEEKLPEMESQWHTPCPRHVTRQELGRSSHIDSLQLDSRPSRFKIVVAALNG